MGRLELALLQGNRFSGPLPSSWSSMAELIALNLNDNLMLSGLLPPSWSSLSSLVWLDAAGNGFQGPVPQEWDYPASLQSLERLDLRQVNTQGAGHSGVCRDGGLREDGKLGQGVALLDDCNSEDTNP